ncbi:gliding motility-associated C-terminal domain-containing protein [Panacibacter sp. DH6]|uniref:Gliding motility-associated C-terminal domain-containing protein n=1 Tax=Panacibacter microcysteis TaxID=2793269 RepID=A0A931E3F8_9BACT|nr:gliding motility-associated C-terminal domain-containing protein [Panacibacter microcysteis]MBG9376890.1 gliding motility-associated C-terminal domain-containing protein [Panacibacter microcysteis]
MWSSNNCVRYEKVIFLLFLYLALSFFTTATFAQAASSSADNGLSAELMEGHNEKGFIQNNGQVSDLHGKKAENVFFAFYARNDVRVYVTNKGLSYVYRKVIDRKLPARHSNNTVKPGEKSDSSKIIHFALERIDVNLVGATIDSANTEVVYATNKTVFNYFSSNAAVANQQLIKKITFKNIYKGIDWVLYINGDTLQKVKYDFVVHKNADAGAIKIRYSSNATVKMSETGSLNISSKFGYIEEGKPLITSENHLLQNAAVAYKLQRNTITFDLDNRLNKGGFTIDPDLVWGSFIRTEAVFDGITSGITVATDVETDNWGNIFVSLVCAGNMQFPTTNPGNGAYYSDLFDSELGGNLYLKFDAAKKLVWATYFAVGECYPEIAVNSKGALIVAAAGDDKLTIPYKNNGGFFDSAIISANFLARFSNDGALEWCTNFASTSIIFSDVETDSKDNIYFTGYIDQVPFLPKKDPGNNAYFNTLAGQNFISRFDDNCNLIWSTLLTGGEECRLATDKYDNIYVLTQRASEGYTLKDAGGFFSPADGVPAGIMKFNSLSQLLWGTYLPGFAEDVAADLSGNIFVVGSPYGFTHPYVDPGNGAYMEPNQNVNANGGFIMRFDEHTNLTWSTTYFNQKSSRFTYVLFEKYRNLVHVYGYLSGVPNGPFPTKNDACNGSYYVEAEILNQNFAPLFLTFTNSGQNLYTSLGDFTNKVTDSHAECAVDNKGNLFYTFGNIEQTPVYTNDVTLKDPGNGAFFQGGVFDAYSYSTYIMQLKPSSLNADTAYTLPKNCNCDGTLSVIPYCGSGNYTYQWSRGDITPVITNVCPGSYSVKLTDLNSYSDTTIQFNIPNPQGSVNSAGIAVGVEHCEKKDGTIEVSNVIGGSAPYSYSINTQAFSTLSTFTGLEAGEYILKVKDNDGCIFIDTVVVSAKEGPSVISATSTTVSCNGVNGALRIDSITGGTQPFVYALNSAPFTTTPSFNKLTPGTYALRVKDSAKCSFIDSFIVVQATPPTNYQLNVTGAHCDKQDGSIFVTAVEGGTAPFSYSLDSIHFYNDSRFTNLASGAQSIIIKDSNDCVITGTFKINNIPGPQKIFFTQTNAICGAETGYVIIDSVQQGTAPFQYAGNEGVFNNSTLVNNLAPGKVLIQVKDAFNCILTDSLIISKTDSLRVSINPADTTVCYNEKIIFNATILSTNEQVLFYWNNVQTPSTSDISNFTGNTVINLRAIDKDGCTVNTNTSVTVKYCDSSLAKCVIFPNAFSPNGDGKNDYFGPRYAGCNIKNYRLIIYDRWGSLLFQANDITKKWDGTRNSITQQPGAYVYYCEWVDELEVKRTYKGTAILVR